MAVRNMYATVSGCTGIREIVLRDSTSQCATAVEVTCVSHTLNIGDFVTVDMGYADEHTAVITDGVVKKITQRRPENYYVIYIYDKLVLTNDFFIAASDPDTKLSYTQVSPEDIIQDLLSRAGVSYGTYYTDATGFLCGIVGNPLELNCVTAWSVIENFNRITTWMTWCDLFGDIHFQNRKPYIMVGDTASRVFTVGNTGDILSIDYVKSDDGIRNRIVVYGKSGLDIQSEQSASSPYLPVGFYKTLVIAHDIIDSQAIADGTAVYNLAMFNRLTETLTVEVVGSPTIRCRGIYAVAEPYTGFTASDLWFATGTQHDWKQTGYVTSVNLIR